MKKKWAWIVPFVSTIRCYSIASFTGAFAQTAHSPTSSVAASDRYNPWLPLHQPWRLTVETGRYDESDPKGGKGVMDDLEYVETELGGIECGMLAFQQRPMSAGPPAQRHRPK